ncbi:Triacylglycerol lipase 2 [Morella rubra]|uniref:Lipase n=1 Tax=Morella rubra TaxID=262757 RepID=A0A6A1WRA4_9ROSI|nr:Triacylglycerol lipase 2 [Morella rubra]
MAPSPRGSLCLAAAAWGFCVLVLAVQPHQAHGLSRGSYGLKTDKLVRINNIGCVSQVTTRDGYILSLQRIPEGRVGGGPDKRQPVLLQHGVLVDGISWMLNQQPEQNLPMILADNGFDVWITNSRGTKYSCRHTSLKASNPAYWDWSWDEMVFFHLPEILDFIQGQTGQKVDYVGQSMGTLVLLVAASEGLLTNRVKSAALLSPIAYLSHITTKIGIVAVRAFVGEILNKGFGISEFDPKQEPVKSFLEFLCAYEDIDCSDLISEFTAVRDGVVAKYNDGSPSSNRAHYGVASTPLYNLSNIPHDLPLFLSYGGRDALSDVQDVNILLDSLRFHEVDKLSVQFVKDYARVDFMAAANAKDVVYNRIVDFFKHQN